MLNRKIDFDVYVHSENRGFRVPFFVGGGEYDCKGSGEVFGRDMDF